MPKSSKTLIPTITEILSSPAIKPLIDNLSPATVITTSKSVLDEIRTEVMSVATEMRMPDLPELIQKIVTRLKEREPTIERPLINATGILFHPEFGAPPLAIEALEQMLQAASRERGARCTQPSRDPKLSHFAYSYDSTVMMLKELCEAEDAMLVDSSLLAKELVFACFARKKDAILSRSEAYENESGERLTDLMRLFGVRPREVGSANRTKTEDYLDAFSSRTGLVYLASRVYANCRFALERELLRDEHVRDFEHQSGFASYKSEERHREGKPQQNFLARSLSALSEETKKRHIPLVMDLQLALYRKLDIPGLENVPILRRCCASGADLVILSGRFLLGGPECGLILGKRQYIEKLRKHPFHHAMLPTPMSLAGLHTVLALHLSKNHLGETNIPVLRLLGASVENLRNRASRLVPLIDAAQSVQSVFYASNEVPLFAEQCPLRLPSYRIHLQPYGRGAEEFGEALLHGNPGIVTNLRFPHRDATWHAASGSWNEMELQNSTNPTLGEATLDSSEFHRERESFDPNNPFANEAPWIEIDLRSVPAKYDIEILNAIETLGKE